MRTLCADSDLPFLDQDRSAGVGSLDLSPSTGSNAASSPIDKGTSPEKPAARA